MPPAPVARLLARMANRPEPGQTANEQLDPGYNQQVIDGVVNMVDRRRGVTKKEVVTQHVTMKPAPGGKKVKSHQAWKYPGGNIVRAPSCVLNGRFYSDHKDIEAGDVADKQGNPPESTLELANYTPRRKQESNFFITINPNRGFQDAEDRARKQFHKALQYLSQDMTFVSYLLFGPKNFDHYHNDKAMDVIEPNIDWKATVEVGEQRHRMHAHIICYVTHYSQIQINPKLLQYHFNQGFNDGLRGDDPLRQTTPPYVQVKMLPQSDWTTIMKQYIRKGMDKSEV